MSERRYTRQFKEEAMKMVTEGGYTFTAAARELGMPDNTLYQWLKKAGWPGPTKSPPLQLPAAPVSDDPVVLKLRVRELEQEVRRLRMEKEILKKATAFFANQNP